MSDVGVTINFNAFKIDHETGRFIFPEDGPAVARTEGGIVLDGEVLAPLTTVANIRAAIGALTNESTLTRDVAPIIAGMVHLRLGVAEREELTVLLKDKKVAGGSLGTLRKMYESAYVEALNADRDPDDYTVHLLRDMFGNVKGCTFNILMTLRSNQMISGLFTYDEFTKNITLARSAPWSPGSPELWVPRELNERDYTQLAAWLQQIGVPVDERAVANCISVVAMENKTNELKSYLTGLAWDGVPRVNAWLSLYVGVPPTAYSRDVGRWWMISACARVMRPGSKVDTMLILQGKQGKKKSWVFKTLAGEKRFLEFDGDTKNKDTLMLMRGIWIFEFAELSSITSKKDVGEVKSFLTKTIDSYRAPYARLTEDHERQCVFGGATNNDTFLSDRRAQVLAS
jgi:putative DNA primase/helicase